MLARFRDALQSKLLADRLPLADHGRARANINLLVTGVLVPVSDVSLSSTASRGLGRKEVVGVLGAGRGRRGLQNGTSGRPLGPRRIH